MKLILISAITDMDTYWRETAYAPPADPVWLDEPEQEDAQEQFEAAPESLVYALLRSGFAGESKWQTH